MYVKMGLVSEKLSSIVAPIKAPKNPGTPNLTTTLQLVFFPTRAVLKRLFSKWTIPVRAIATSTLKNNANTGINKVPNPKPEKKVSSEANKAVSPISKISIIDSFQKNNLQKFMAYKF